MPPLDGMKELLAGFTASIGKRIDALADQVQAANKNAEEAKRLAQNKHRGNALQQRLLDRVDKQGVIEALALFSMTSCCLNSVARDWRRQWCA